MTLKARFACKGGREDTAREKVIKIQRDQLYFSRAILSHGNNFPIIIKKRRKICHCRLRQSPSPTTSE